MSKEKCVLCRESLVGGHYVRLPGKPITYDQVFYCDNHSCPRYGLLSIYKLAKKQPGTPGGKS